mmetsp:Transcript_82847/g.213478  ORF Transcript_82847/g.213478 Transcript_82847/m.213478 type:complete len:243 (+) Transcript_82847:28-756(+)
MISATVSAAASATFAVRSRRASKSARGPCTSSSSESAMEWPLVTCFNSASKFLTSCAAAALAAAPWLSSPLASPRAVVSAAAVACASSSAFLAASDAAVASFTAGAHAAAAARSCAALSAKAFCACSSTRQSKEPRDDGDFTHAAGRAVLRDSSRCSWAMNGPRHSICCCACASSLQVPSRSTAKWSLAAASKAALSASLTDWVCFACSTAASADLRAVDASRRVPCAWATFSSAAFTASVL